MALTLKNRFVSDTLKKFIFEKELTKHPVRGAFTHILIDGATLSIPSTSEVEFMNLYMASVLNARVDKPKWSICERFGGYNNRTAPFFDFDLKFKIHDQDGTSSVLRRDDAHIRRIKDTIIYTSCKLIMRDILKLLAIEVPNTHYAMLTIGSHVAKSSEGIYKIGWHMVVPTMCVDKTVMKLLHEALLRSISRNILLGKDGDMEYVDKWDNVFDSNPYNNGSLRLPFSYKVSRCTCGKKIDCQTCVGVGMHYKDGVHIPLARVRVVGDDPQFLVHEWPTEEDVMNGLVCYDRTDESSLHLIEFSIFDLVGLGGYAPQQYIETPQQLIDVIPECIVANGDTYIHGTKYVKKTSKIDNFDKDSAMLKSVVEYLPSMYKSVARRKESLHMFLKNNLKGVKSARLCQKLSHKTTEHGSKFVIYCNLDCNYCPLKNGLHNSACVFMALTVPHKITGRRHKSVGIVGTIGCHSRKHNHYKLNNAFITCNKLLPNGAFKFKGDNERFMQLVYPHIQHLIVSKTSTQPSSTPQLQQTEQQQSQYISSIAQNTLNTNNERCHVAVEHSVPEQYDELQKIVNGIIDERDGYMSARVPNYREILRNTTPMRDCAKFVQNILSKYEKRQ